MPPPTHFWVTSNVRIVSTYNTLCTSLHLIMRTWRVLFQSTVNPVEKLNPASHYIHQYFKTSNVSIPLKKRPHNSKMSKCWKSNSVMTLFTSISYYSASQLQWSFTPTMPAIEKPRWLSGTLMEVKILWVTLAVNNDTHSLHRVKFTLLLVTSLPSLTSMLYLLLHSRVHAHPDWLSVMWAYERTDARRNVDAWWQLAVMLCAVNWNIIEHS